MCDFSLEAVRSRPAKVGDKLLRDVNPERPVLPRHALRDHTQTCFRGGEVRKPGLASQARGSSSENDRAGRAEPIAAPPPGQLETRQSSRPARTPRIAPHSAP
jgi:hypothetical protein